MVIPPPSTIVGGLSFIQISDKEMSLTTINFLIVIVVFTSFLIYNKYMQKTTIKKYKALLLEQKETLEKELEKIAKRDPNQKGNWNTIYLNYEPNEFDEEEAADEVQEYVNRLPVEHALELCLKKKKKKTQKKKKKI